MMINSALRVGNVFCIDCVGLKCHRFNTDIAVLIWWRGKDLNLRPSGYENTDYSVVYACLCIQLSLLLPDDRLSVHTLQRTLAFD